LCRQLVVALGQLEGIRAINAVKRAAMSEFGKESERCEGSAHYRFMTLDLRRRVQNIQKSMARWV
jgi:hypothetical protein